MKHYDILLISTADWDNPFWTNKQHVALQLAKIGHRVFYIDSLGLRKPSASKQDVLRIVKRLIKAFTPPRNVRDNIWVWSPIILPWHNNRWVRIINRFILKTCLWLGAKWINHKQEWIWTYNPLTTEFFDLSKFSTRVYHCVDEIKAQPGMPATVLERAEECLARGVDVIFTTSPQLTQSRRLWNTNTYYLPNVADYDHFNTALAIETVIPQDLEIIPKPRIGFIGAISSYKVDFTLIRKIADSHPEWSIVLIGAIGEGDPWTESMLLQGVDNIHLLGPKSYKSLPSYLKGFDVTLLPNTLNEYTDAMFPMKFFEYLAAGRVIVSVKLKAISEFSNISWISESHDDFIVNIEKSLSGQHADLELRLATARKYTYEARTRRMMQIISELNSN